MLVCACVRVSVGRNVWDPDARDSMLRGTYYRCQAMGARPFPRGVFAVASTSLVRVHALHSNQTAATATATTAAASSGNATSAIAATLSVLGADEGCCRMLSTTIVLYVQSDSLLEYPVCSIVVGSQPFQPIIGVPIRSCTMI